MCFGFIGGFWTSFLSPIHFFWQFILLQYGNFSWAGLFTMLNSRFHRLPGECKMFFSMCHGKLFTQTCKKGRIMETIVFWIGIMLTDILKILFSIIFFFLTSCTVLMWAAQYWALMWSSNVVRYPVRRIFSPRLSDTYLIISEKETLTSCQQLRGLTAGPLHPLASPCCLAASVPSHGIITPVCIPELS